MFFGLRSFLSIFQFQVYSQTVMEIYNTHLHTCLAEIPPLPFSREKNLLLTFEIRVNSRITRGQDMKLIHCVRFKHFMLSLGLYLRTPVSKHF